MAVAETISQRHNIVITGFLGSGHEQLAIAVADLLGRQAVSSYTLFTENALRRGDLEYAADSEIAVLNAMLERDEPLVLDVRASTFCRTDAQAAIKKLGALTAFLDIPSMACSRGLASMQLHDLERAAAESELGMYTFGSVGDATQNAADVVVSPRLTDNMPAIAGTLVNDFAQHDGLLVPALAGGSTARTAVVSRGATILQFPR
ncbi:MAG TPA: hypothetical protein VLI54_03305 [Bacillota bacterium]|nr:hypothetical protein [Bacillota bacterium]